MQELIGFAKAGVIVDRLNAFIPDNSWDGPTVRSLTDSVVDAVGREPQMFLGLLPSFLNAKYEYQYAVIAGFKKQWDAWDGKKVGFDWNDAWPKLIEFFEKILGDRRLWSAPNAEDDSLSPNRIWIPPVISEFLKAGTRSDDKAYAPDLLPRTWVLTRILLQKSERQQNPSDGDAMTAAICLAYLWDQEGLESPRLALLFDLSRIDDLDIACRYFWSIRDQNLYEAQKENILLFWDKCVTWAKAIDPPPASLLSTLSLLSCYLEAVGPRELSLLLAVAPYVSFDYNGTFFIEELERLVKTSPVQVGKVLVTMLQTYQTSFDYEDRLKNLILKLAAHPATRPDAIHSAERLRSVPGMLQIYEQLISQSELSSPAG